MKLSKHFTLGECTFSETAKMCGLDNTPPPEAIERMKALCEHVFEPIRKKFASRHGFRPGSVYRSPRVNERVGGSARSDHLTGCAGDIEVPGVPNIELARWIRDDLTFDQLILEFAEDWETDPTDGWVHVSWEGEDPNKHEILTIWRPDLNGPVQRLLGLPGDDT